MKRPAGLVMLLGSLAILVTAPAASSATDCGRAGVVCSRVSVPLDPSGQLPGHVALHVEELKAVGHQRGVMFLLAGGPGQAATRAFSLAAYAPLWREYFPGYTLVAFDARGSGGSDPLTCKGSEEFCGEELGPKRDFYSTADNARDVDAVRQALGFKRISLWGVSYGTELALAYAQMFPSQTQRLLLDSVVSPMKPDPFATETLRQLPSRLDAFCAASACPGVTGGYGREVVALANDLAAKPLQAWVNQPSGTQRRERLSASDFLSLVIQTDLDPGLAAEMPAAVHAARHGDPRPLLRLLDLVMHITGDSSAAISDPLSLATICDDGPFPWQPATPLRERPALLRSALASLPTASFGGFGAWAHALGTATACLSWPVSPAASTLPAGSSFPDIPVLALSGGFDLRTPTSGARAVVSSFPHGHLLEVANTGHSVLTTSITSCVARSVRGWLAGREIAQACAAPRLIDPLGPFPSLVQRTTQAARHTATMQQVASVVHEAEAAWLLAMSEDGWRSTSVAGLTSGRLTGGVQGFTLTRYGIGNGLVLSGAVRAHIKYDHPFTFEGALRVGGQGTAHTGTVYVGGGRLFGRLDHKLIFS